MASITSPGLGSGLDVNSIVTQLVAAEGQPATLRLDRKEANLQARLSGYGTLRSSLSSFQSSLSKLSSMSSFQANTANSSAKDVLVATADKSAAAGNYQLDVTQLATAHSLVTDASLPGGQFSSLSDVVGTGTLTFKFGTTVADTDSYTSFTQNADAATATVEITDGSLTGIRDAINNADIGVSASIIYDGSYYRLTLASDDTGAANSMEITVADDDANATDASGLSLLSFNAGANHLQQTAAAKDAALTLNGVAVSSASNRLSDTVDGVTFNLLSAGSSTVTVSQNTAEASKLIKGFVDSYNNLTKGINSLAGYDAATQKSGVLNGDGIVSSIKNQVDRLLTTPVDGVTGDYSILAEIGITRNTEDGTLNLDDTKLQASLRDNMSDVVDLFAASGRTDDSLIQYQGSSDASQIGNYAVNITQLATQGNLTGSAAANLTITAGVNDTMDIEVDGVATSITLSAGTYTSASLVAELQSRINGASEIAAAGSLVTVSESGGVLSITSSRYGSASAVQVTGGNGATDLFGATPVDTAGVDVAGTIGGIAATGSGQTLSGTGDAAGLSIDVTGGLTGDRGSLNFSRGFASQLDDLLADLLDENGIFTTVTDSINDQIEDVNKDRSQLAVRLASFEARTRAQFTALDLLVSKLQGTGDYLTDQLAALPVIGAQSK